MHIRPVPVLASLLVLVSLSSATANPDRPACGCAIKSDSGRKFRGAKWEDGVCYELRCMPGDCVTVAGKKTKTGAIDEKDGILVRKPRLGMSHEGCMDLSAKKP